MHCPPPSEIRTKSLERPAICTWFAGNRASIPKALRLRRWQAKQWHMEIRIGSPSAVSRSCPQLQAASRLAMTADPTEAHAHPRATSSIEVLLLAPECGSKRLIAQRLEHVARASGLVRANAHETLT